MTAQPEEHTLYTPLDAPLVHAPLVADSALLPIATWISHLLNPPVMGLAAALLCGAALQTPVAWVWTAVYLLVAALMPAGYVVWLFRRGKISDLHMNKREERFGPMLVMIGGAVTGWLLLSWGGAPRVLLVLAGAQALNAFIFYWITLHWKISQHTSSIAALTVLFCIVQGRVGIVLLPVVLLVAWARVVLRRHTTPQTMAGAALGALTMTAVFLLYTTVPI